MTLALHQILPSLESLGIWSYWIIGLASMLEAFFATGAFAPGTLVVEAGGVLVQQGAIDFFDLVWFVAIGSIIGAELSYWVGVVAKRGLSQRWKPEQSRSYQKAERLFQRHGGMALVIGRFLGPVSGLVPFVASLMGMDRRRFVFWNIFSGFPYALGHVALGYFLGDIFTRIGPITTRFALFAVAVLFALAVLWWLVARVIRMLPLVLSILRSVAQAVAENPDVQSWAGRRPRLAHFISSRFDRSHFGGLAATLLFSVAVYILIIWVGSAADFLMADPILATDVRLANLTHAFWSPGPLLVFSYVTALGDWRVVGLILLAALSILLARKRIDLAIGLVVALAGNVVSVSIVKSVFDRPRPDFAYFIETSGSFPSGHAAISVALYATLFYIAWRLKWLRASAAALLAVTVAFLVGFSRIYLIEHYLTDVLNGWLIGALWLVIGISISEWWRTTHTTRLQSAQKPALLVSALISVTLLVGAGWIGATYEKPRNQPVLTTQAEVVAAPVQIFSDNKGPASTESIGGTPLEPINIIVIAKDTETLNTTMQQAGWVRAGKPGIASLFRAAWAALNNMPYDNAPVTPYFWNRAPNDVAFQRPTNDNSIRERHHVRFWQTRFLTAQGMRIFVGAASFDVGLDWTLLHLIDPNIDAERDILAKDLQKLGTTSQAKLIRILPPHMGKSVAGDPWFTDGKAVVIQIDF